MPASSAPDLPDALGTLAPPPRFRAARFEAYRAEAAGQEQALAARAFARRMQQPPSLTRRAQAWASRRLPVSAPEAPRGLYLVGPAGTGKTHLMAAIYHHLMPEVPCVFVHSSRFFRSAEHPERLARTLLQAGPRGGRSRVLMLDEVELDDAANEARLAHFLRVLGEEGVALVATSNARPGEFLTRHVAAGGRHRRFLRDALAGRCELLFVEGADRRRAASAERRGRVFVGPPDEAAAALRRAFEADDRRACWLSFDALCRASYETAHARLVDRLLEAESLYVAGVVLEGTDDALRLLRIIDDLYVAPDAPALFFSAAAPPEGWFAAGAGEGLAGGIAEKFVRTASRLRELCEVERVDAATHIA